MSPDPLWPRDKWFEVDELREREILRLATWILQRIRTVPHIADWIPVDLPHDGGHCSCERCAPTPPEIRWFKKPKGNSYEVKAIEDPQQAAPYERALKTRPSPFQIHVKYSTTTRFGEVVIGVNPVTLVHRAASLLPNSGLNRKGTINADWRLDTNYVPAAVLSKPNFVLSSNRHDRSTKQPEQFKIPLRPEQLRSLTWMIAQENPKIEPFVEMEICEGVSEHLGWRIEGRARRDVMVRGGVLADQVGYGKTAIMLGLIDSRPGKLARREDRVSGTIPVKATVVVVPAHLCLQWADEVKKFFKPKSVTVEVLHQGSSINKLTIEDVQDADIIIVASSIFNQSHYGENLSSFSGVSIPDKATRYQRERLKLAKEALAQQVERLQKEGAKSVLTHIKKAHENGMPWFAGIIVYSYLAQPINKSSSFSQNVSKAARTPRLTRRSRKLCKKWLTISRDKKLSSKRNQWSVPELPSRPILLHPSHSPSRRGWFSIAWRFPGWKTSLEKWQRRRS